MLQGDNHIDTVEPKPEPKGVLPRERLEDFMLDIRDEPLWRVQANREADYYDNNQLDSETLEEMRERGIAPLVRNLVAPTIDAVLGMEAKSRQDFKVVADMDEDSDFSRAMNIEMHEAERMSKADRATSDAYAAQIKVGLGWVEVSRAWNPFDYKYRSRYIHRREMFWDWKAVEGDLSDARYLMRRKWYELDFLKEIFPDHANLLNKTMNSQMDWDYIEDGDMDLSTGYNDELRTSIEEAEWRDTHRNRLCLYEVWYRIWERAFIFRLPNDEVIEFDDENERHIAIIGSGMATLEQAVIPRVRLSWWVGPHQMDDMPSPYKHGAFPYVPFWGMREDRTGIPYGLIRRMMSPQDEVNTRLSKMMWLMSAKRVMADSDAFEMSPESVLDEVARPDAFIPLNPDRKNKNQKPDIDTDREMSTQQFNVLKDATQAIQDTGGVYQEMLGKTDQAISGVAIASLVEQGSNTLAEINDNYRDARKTVGNLLLSLVIEDKEQTEYSIDIKRGGKTKSVPINKFTQDENGNTIRENSMVMAKMRLELTSVPQTPTYKAQQHRDLMELTKGLPDEMQAVIVPLVIRGSDLDGKDDVAKRIEQLLGMNSEDMDQEQIDAKEREDAFTEQQASNDMREQLAKTKESEAKAEKMNVETAKLLEEVRLQRGMTVDEMALPKKK